MEDILVIHYLPRTKDIVKSNIRTSTIECIIINPKAPTPVNTKYLDEMKDEEWEKWKFHSACSTGDPTRVMLIYTKK